MEKRFGIKDLFLFLLLVVLIVTVVLAMRQFDRQFDHVQVIKQRNTELTGDVARINSSLARLMGMVEELQSRQFVEAPAGTATAPTTRPDGGNVVQPKEDAFAHIKEAEKQPGFARGDWLIDNFGTKIGRLTPMVATDVYQTWIESQVLEGMVDRDPMTLEFRPRLATRWKISEDGLKMTFWLRRGVTFSDGEPLDADDVIFTFKWAKNPAVDAERVRAYLTKLVDFKKIDQYTVEFTFSEYYYLNFSTIASTSIMPEHFYSKYTPEQFNEMTGLLMGSGPYRLESPNTWVPTGEGVTLIRNERYWGTPPTFDRLIFRELQGESTEMVLYGNQELDLLRCVPEQYRKLINDQRIMSFSNNLAYENMYGGYIYCGWNQSRKVNGAETPTHFADKRVRQAMTILLDRERMAKEIFLGYATPASGPFAPQGPQSAPDIKAWAFDEAKAKSLLAAAGYQDRNGDGIVDGPNGQPFKFKLSYPSGSETWEKVVLFMKDSYARAGILMEPDRLDWPVLVQKLKQSDFDAATLGWSSTPESDPYQIFHSSQIQSQGDNRTNYINKDLDALIEKARTTVDTEARMKIWNDVHRILHEDQPYTFLFNRQALRLFNKRIKNIQPAKIGINFEYLNGGMMPWYVPSNEQKYSR